MLHCLYVDQPYALACSWHGVHKDSGCASAEAQASVLASVAVEVQELQEGVAAAVVAQEVWGS